MKFIILGNLLKCNPLSRTLISAQLEGFETAFQIIKRKINSTKVRTRDKKQILYRDSNELRLKSRIKYTMLGYSLTASNLNTIGDDFQKLYQEVFLIANLELNW